MKIGARLYSTNYHLVNIHQNNITREFNYQIIGKHASYKDPCCSSNRSIRDFKQTIVKVVTFEIIELQQIARKKYVVNCCRNSLSLLSSKYIII